MTILEGLHKNIEILSSIKTPKGVPVKDFMDGIGLPIYGVISDLQSMADFLEKSVKAVEEQTAANETGETGDGEAPKLEIVPTVSDEPPVEEPVEPGETKE